jgi:hypothetical protein
MAVARAMLDAEHGTPDKKDNGDHNSYFLGSIGDHNVVIACLPAGLLGGVSAATVAAQMQRTFKHVRVGLLVGIGSSALSAEHDIRLGDIVVSMPSGDNGGVIQYECTHLASTAPAVASAEGSSSGSVEFAQTRCLNKPPVVLLMALTSF